MTLMAIAPKVRLLIARTAKKQNHTDRHEGYTLGDEAFATLTIGKVIGEGRGEIGLNYTSTSAIKGADSAITGSLQFADTANYGGKRLIAEISYRMGNGIGFEVALPIRQQLNGTQMSLLNFI